MKNESVEALFSSSPLLPPCFAFGYAGREEGEVPAIYIVSFDARSAQALAVTA